jgi:hypothetical protein
MDFQQAERIAKALERIANCLDGATTQAKKSLDVYVPAQPEQSILHNKEEARENYAGLRRGASGAAPASTSRSLLNGPSGGANLTHTRPSVRCKWPACLKDFGGCTVGCASR